jgi:hypothetical protein
MTLERPMFPPRDHSRRGFLSQAASVAVGGAVLALGTVPPRPAMAAPASPLAAANASPATADPIFAAIEAHRAAHAVVCTAVDTVSAREVHLREEGKRMGTPERDDDAQLQEHEAILSLAFRAEDVAACVLVDERPTTMAGVMALLQYAITADIDGEGWPSDLVSDDGDERSWQFFLLTSLVEVLPGLVPVAS